MKLVKHRFFVSCVSYKTAHKKHNRKKEQNKTTAEAPSPECKGSTHSLTTPPNKTKKDQQKQTTGQLNNSAYLLMKSSGSLRTSLTLSLLFSGISAAFIQEHKKDIISSSILMTIVSPSFLFWIVCIFLSPHL